MTSYVNKQLITLQIVFWSRVSDTCKQDCSLIQSTLDNAATAFISEELGPELCQHWYKICNLEIKPDIAVHAQIQERLIFLYG